MDITPGINKKGFIIEYACHKISIPYGWKVIATFFCQRQTTIYTTHSLGIEK